MRLLEDARLRVPSRPTFDVIARDWVTFRRPQTYLYLGLNELDTASASQQTLRRSRVRQVFPTLSSIYELSNSVLSRVCVTNEL